MSPIWIHTKDLKAIHFLLFFFLSGRIYAQRAVQAIARFVCVQLHVSPCTCNLINLPFQKGQLYWSKPSASTPLNQVKQISIQKKPNTPQSICFYVTGLHITQLRNKYAENVVFVNPSYPFSENIPSMLANIFRWKYRHNVQKSSARDTNAL